MLENYRAGLKTVKNRKDSILLYLLDGKIYAYNRLKKYDNSLDYTDSLITAANFQQDTSFIALGFYRKASVHKYLHNYEEEFENAFISRQFYLQIGDSTGYGRRSLEMANAQMQMSDYTGSQETATEALRYLQPANRRDSSFVSSAYNIIAVAYRQQGFEEDAIAEYKNALRYSVSRADSLSYLNNMALVYQDTGRILIRPLIFLKKRWKMLILKMRNQLFVFWIILLIRGG